VKLSPLTRFVDNVNWLFENMSIVKYSLYIDMVSRWRTWRTLNPDAVGQHSVVPWWYLSGCWHWSSLIFISSMLVLK